MYTLCTLNGKKLNILLSLFPGGYGAGIRRSRWIKFLRIA
jgi:hypothetical protein